MYKIGELSKLSNIPVKTLRFYDSEGILPPDKIDDFTGYRYYNASKLSDCYRIITLKELGFSLSEIKEIFALTKDEYSKLIAKKTKELENLKAETEKRISTLHLLNSSLKENECMFDILIRKSDRLNLAYYREIVNSKSQYNDILYKMVKSLPSEIVGDRKVIIDYETEFANHDFDTGFGIEIIGKLPKSSILTEKIIDFTTDTASLICFGSDYDKAVNQLNKFVLDNDYQIVGPTYKIIYTDGTIEIKLPVVKLGEFNINYNDDIKIPFENDPEVVGRWVVFDALPCKEMFNPQKAKSVLSNDLIKELYFLPNGEKYWCFNWTKGLLLSNCGYPHRKSQNKYTIEKIGNDIFMFIEFKTYDYFQGGMPEILVLKKENSKAYTKEEIMIKDKIPTAPSTDINVIGKWDVCDLVRSPTDFNPQNMYSFVPPTALFWRSAEFIKGGQMINTFKTYEEKESHTDAPNVWRWVNEYAICNPRQTASKYIIKIIEHTKYLFVEWKSGDYSFGGETPFWYVFKRA